MNKKKTYKLQLPKDVNVDKAHLRIHDGKIVVDVEFKEEIKPKDGDFLVSASGAVFIYSDSKPLEDGLYSSYVGEFVNKKYGIHTSFSSAWCNKEGCRFATREEKSAFLERLEKECHKTWNAEKKCLEDVYVPKDGDFCVVNDCVFIYKKESRLTTLNGYYVGIGRDGDIYTDTNGMFGFVSVSYKIRPATEIEKNNLIERLKNKLGKKWNPETKQLEDIRWRPEEGEPYFFIDKSFNVDCIRYLHEYDCGRIEANNCFKTKEAAQPYADKFKDMLKQSKAE